MNRRNNGAAAHRTSTPGLCERADVIAARGHAALLDELATWPKPGLVSPVDTGSHDDMDALTFRRSAAALEPFFARLAIAGARDADLPTLRRIGLQAERAMMDATSGVNTHRGAIFALGLLCAASGGVGAGASPDDVCEEVRRRWGSAIPAGPAPAASHGAQAHRRYGAGGARAEAAAGFPTARGIGLPALAEGRKLAPDVAEAAHVHCFFALLARVEDTNLLHRGGMAGLAFARQTARAFLDRGGVERSDWRREAERAHRAFVARRLSPGGSADLLAVTLFLDASRGPS